MSDVALKVVLTAPPNSETNTNNNTQSLQPPDNTHDKETQAKEKTQKKAKKMDRFEIAYTKMSDDENDDIDAYLTVPMFQDNKPRPKHSFISPHISTNSLSSHYTLRDVEPDRFPCARTLTTNVELSKSLGLYSKLNTKSRSKSFHRNPTSKKLKRRINLKFRNYARASSQKVTDFNCTNMLMKDRTGKLLLDRRRSSSDWVLSSMEEQDRQFDHTHLDAPSYVQTAPSKRLLDYNAAWKRTYFVLTLVAVIAAVLSFVIAKTTEQAWTWQTILYSRDELQVAYSIPVYLIQVCIKITLVIAAILLTRTFAPESAGSGVPELRAILSGIWIKKYLSMTTFFTKAAALTLALSAGLPIGLEGPFIHFSAIIGRQLTKLNAFSHLDRRQILSAACAGGVASVFGAPIGGVLFSIEVTSTYYPVTNYWTAFCCAMVGSTLTIIIQSYLPTNLLLFQTDFSDADAPETVEYVYVALLGLVTGVIGVAFIFSHAGYVALRIKYQRKYLGNNPFGIAVVVIVLFTTILFFVGDFASNPARKAVSDMFNVISLLHCDGEFAPSADLTCKNILKTADSYSCSIQSQESICESIDYCRCYYHDWDINAGLLPNLAIFCVANFFYTIAALTLLIPCGMFGPTFTLGSVIGRIFGEILSSSQSHHSDPRTYSVIAAAALTAAVTQTISPAVIALEVTGDITLAIPMLLAVVVSDGVTSSLTQSFYDSILHLRGIPMLPSQPTVSYKRVVIKQRPQGRALIRMISSSSEMNPESLVESYRLVIANDVMESSFLFVTIDATPEQVTNALLQSDQDQEWFPIVHSASELVLVGEVRRSVLMDYLKLIAPDVYELEMPEQLLSAQNLFLAQSANTIRDQACLLEDSTLLSERTQWHKNVKGNSKNVNDIELQKSRLPGEQGQDERDKSDSNLLTCLAPSNSNSLSSSQSEPSVSPDNITLMSPGFIERINLSPIQVISEMPLTKIYTLFHILKPRNVYVTKYSRLIGVINEMQLLERELQHQTIAYKTKFLFQRCKRTIARKRGGSPKKNRNPIN